MASSELLTEPTHGQRLYSAWRFARAQWELARYCPENAGGELPDDVDASHCDADHVALCAYLLHPAATWHELARKLRVFNQEDGSGFTQASEITAALAEDAQRMAVDDVIERSRNRAA